MKKKIIIGVTVLVLIGIGIIYNNLNQNKIEINADNNYEIPNSRILVQINGAVVKPGIYEMNAEDRINDLIILSGGFTDRAEQENINLVAKLSDGMVINIKTKDKINQPIENEKQLISINNASINELIDLDGIGEAKARNIISYRELNGGFKNIDELKNVSGISETIFNNIKSKICL